MAEQLIEKQKLNELPEVETMSKEDYLFSTTKNETSKVKIKNISNVIMENNKLTPLNPFQNKGKIEVAQCVQGGSLVFFIVIQTNFVNPVFLARIAAHPNDSYLKATALHIVGDSLSATGASFYYKKQDSSTYFYIESSYKFQIYPISINAGIFSNRETSEDFNKLQKVDIKEL